jgi:hypothetical protein
LLDQLAEANIELRNLKKEEEAIASSSDLNLNIPQTSDLKERKILELAKEVFSLFFFIFF